MKQVIMFTILMLLMFSTSALAGVKVKSINYNDAGRESGLVSILYSGKLNTTPELMIRNSIIQVSVPKAVVWPKIEKKISIDKKLDTTILAYQFNKKMVRVRALLPFSMKGREGEVSLTVKGDRIDILFPTMKGSDRVKKNVSRYDESYLEQLLKNKKAPPRGIVKTEPEVKDVKDAKKEDVVKSSLSGIDKINNSVKKSFSMGKYVGKLVGFLALVLLLFYGIVHLMKKGVLKKGKLGFLNNMKPVNVLSTTYIGPKRSILTVKAHNQIFLIGSSEKGIHFLSEITDAAGFLKKGEEKVAGDNFDTNVEVAVEDDKPQKIKENINVSKEDVSGLSVFLNSGAGNDKGKLSDRIKSKVKGLKSLQ
ncbi:MAG: FliO/MopB family protein [Bacteriovoracaceae bacterium]|nr:FliO/MopB family protein [Bacteriovoracaceae bacterium]